MPPENHHLLTAVDYQRIREYKLQGLTHAAIAKEVGCYRQQVGKYLRSLLAETTHTIPITRSQYLMMVRFKESGLTSQVIAARLQVDADILYRELAGYKSMSTRRMGLLKKLFEENAPTEKIPKKIGRPLGSRHE